MTAARSPKVDLRVYDPFQIWGPCWFPKFRCPRYGLCSPLLEGGCWASPILSFRQEQLRGIIANLPSFFPPHAPNPRHPSSTEFGVECLGPLGLMLRRFHYLSMERQPCKHPGTLRAPSFQEKTYLSQSPSPGRRATPPRSAMNLGRVRWVITSAVQDLRVQSLRCGA